MFLIPILLLEFSEYGEPQADTVNRFHWLAGAIDHLAEETVDGVNTVYGDRLGEQIRITKLTLLY